VTSLTGAQRGHLAMLCFSALVAGSFSLGSMAAPHISPLALTSARFLLAGALVGGAAWMFGGIRRDAFRAPWRYLVLGSLLALYFVLMFQGLKTAEPVATSAVFTLTPIMAAGFGWLTLRQRLTGRMALALGFGAAGALWVIFRGDINALMRLHVGRGEMIYFFGCVAHALYAPLIRKLNRGEPAVLFTFGMMAAGWLLLTVIGWGDIRATDWVALPGIVWITLAYVAIVASALTFVLLQYATLRLPAAKVMAYTYLTPSWVILWEIALGRPAPPLAVLGGVALSVLALVLLLKDETAPLRHDRADAPVSAKGSAP
jgi:drug/metabolite transporter (DMT)-like permease